MINYDYPTLFITEGTQKDFLLTDGEVTISGTTYTVSDETIKFVNDDLEMEAFELNQSLNSSDQITFGSCEAAQIRFTARKAYGNSISDNSIVGTVLKLYLIPNHDASKMLQFGVYKVDEDKTTQDKNRHIITAYDAMYDILNKDVTDWYDDILQDEEATCTIEDFRDSFLNQFDLDVESTTLVNDNITIRRTIEKDRISGAEIIKAICEINGVFGTITNEGKFRFVALPNQIWGNDPLPEIPVSMYSEESHRDRVLSIQKLIIRCNDTISMTVGTPRIAEYNTYVISYNPLISDFTMAELRPVAFGLYQIVKGHAYAACSISALGNPLFEVGDAVKILTKSGSNYRTFIFERRLRGIQALRDTYSANGERYLSENLNSSYTQSKTMESQISQITSGSGAYGTDKNFPEIIRNIGFRLLDEPTDVSVEYDEVSNEISLKWTDPNDIATNEPVPATWAGTVIVRKEGSAPLNRYDGTEIVDSTTRDQYSSTAYSDNTIQSNKEYYYGIFPYDTNGYVRYTKVVHVSVGEVYHEPDRWVTKTWGGEFQNVIGEHVWTDGEHIYYSYGEGKQYVLNKDTDTWEYKTWNIPEKIIFGFDIWTDGEHIYLSNYSSSYANNGQYVLNKNTGEWEPKTWNYIYLSGVNIWTDGEDIYMLTNFKFNKNDGTWEYYSWSGTNLPNAQDIWREGEHVYSSYNSDQFVLDKPNNRWLDKTWYGRSGVAGRQIWTDGVTIFFSADGAQYTLNVETDTWVAKTWNPSYFRYPYGQNIWTDGERYFYSNEGTQKELQ